MKNIVNPDYLAKVKLLNSEETERLLSRMGGKLERKWEKNKLSSEEALAIQLEKEDEQLNEWRKVMHQLKEKERAKEEAKPKDESKQELEAKPKEESKPKLEAKPTKKSS